MENLYNPGEKEKQTIRRVYSEYSKMKDLRGQRWKYFNDRTLKEYIDDSQLRLNCYVPTRESQGKETWQANVFHPVTRNKSKALLASVALDVPKIRIVAQNDKQERDRNRADVIKNLVRFSYDQDNKEEQIFFEAWECLEKGTIVVYDGYLKSKETRKVIKSYDPITGEVETEEQELETENRCVSFTVPLLNFFIKDWSIYDIQKQPSLCWVERMGVDEFNTEFGKYKKSKFVKTSTQLTDENENDSFFREFQTIWQERDKDDEPIEIVRYYNKGKDEFMILANGVLLHNSPLILGKKKKWYPFAKTVFEPFAFDFFYGNSLPNSLMGEQDVINSLYNMALDKTYKSMAPALLIGNVNKDDFDLEDQNTTIDTKIYVQDIAQVREMPIKGVSSSDFQMLEMISRGLDLSSVDAAQQGVQGKGVSAREVVIANENAKKLKGILYMFLTSLWIQKIKLRIMNILVYYTQPKVDSAIGEKGAEFQSFMVENAELSPVNGTEPRKGTLGIKMVESNSDLPTSDELDIEEEYHKKKSGEDYEFISITSDYLDDWVYDVKVVSESIYQQESSITQLKQEEKLRVMATYFPQILMGNTEKMAKDTIIAYDDDPDDYDILPPPPPEPMPVEQAAGGTPPKNSGAPPVPGASKASAGSQSLPPMTKLKA